MTVMIRSSGASPGLEIDSAATSVLTIVMRVGEIIQVWCLCSEKGRVLRTEASEIHTFKC